VNAAIVRNFSPKFESLRLSPGDEVGTVRQIETNVGTLDRHQHAVIAHYGRSSTSTQVADFDFGTDDESLNDSPSRSEVVNVAVGFCAMNRHEAIVAYD
jgi:hypothetical protein